MSTEKNYNKIAKYLSDNMESEERESLFSWIEENKANKEVFEDSLEVWEAADPEAILFEVDSDAAWSKMEQRIDQKRQTDGVNTTLKAISILKPILRVAAVAILAVMASLWYFRSTPLNETIVHTNPTEKTTVDLPDGSRVWLNENSELRYERTFDQRIVHLEGEGFFEVAKKEGQTFEIFAGGTKTSVLGTSFNVRAYPEEDFVEVAVSTGKVEFSSVKKKESQTILQPTEYGIYAKPTTSVTKQTGKQLNATAWKDQALYLEEAKMGQIIDALERYFSIEIDVKNKAINNCVWANTIKKIDNPKLGTIIDQINFANPFRIRQTSPGKYELSGEGCLE